MRADFDQATTRAQRILAVTLLVTLVLVAYVSAVEPWMQRQHELAEALDSTYFQVAKLRVAARRAPREADATWNRNEHYVFTGDTILAATSSIQRWLRTQSRGFRVSVRNMSSTTVSGPAGLERVRFAVQVQGVLGGVTGLLHAVETHRPAMIVDRLVMRPVRDSAARDGQEPLLDVQLDISAFYAQN